MTKKRFWLVLGATLLLALLSLVLSRSWWEGEHQVVGPLYSTIEAGEGGTLSAETWLRTGQLVFGENVEYQISVHNRSTNDLSIRFLRFDSPGFAKTGACWYLDLPACLAPKSRAGGVVTLPAGRAVGLSGQFTALGASGQFRPLLLLQLEGETLGRELFGVPLGAVEISSVWERGIRRATVRAYSIAKDLAVPIAVVILGLLYQLWERRQAIQKKQAEDDRERNEQDRRREAEEAEKERARAFETWARVLSQSLNDAQQHYMPMLTKLRRFHEVSGSKSTASQQGLRTCLHSLLMLNRQAKLHRAAIGGFHFSSREGEDVVASCWAALLTLFKDRLDERHLSACLAEFDQHLTLGLFLAFVERKEKDPTHPLVELERRLESWTKAEDLPLEQALVYVELWHTVMGFEINRPFLKYWYGSTAEQEFPCARVLALRDKIPTLPAKQAEQLRDDLKAYLERLDCEESKNSGDSRREREVAAVHDPKNP